MKILVIFFMTIFIQSCLLYSSEDEAWHNLNKMYKEANGKKICMKYKGNVHVMYYCENENKEQ